MRQAGPVVGSRDGSAPWRGIGGSVPAAPRRLRGQGRPGRARRLPGWLGSAGSGPGMVRQLLLLLRHEISARPLTPIFPGRLPLGASLAKGRRCVAWGQRVGAHAQDCLDRFPPAPGVGVLLVPLFLRDEVPVQCEPTNNPEEREEPPSPSYSVPTTASITWPVITARSEYDGRSICSPLVLPDSYWATRPATLSTPVDRHQDSLVSVSPRLPSIRSAYQASFAPPRRNTANPLRLPLVGHGWPRDCCLYDQSPRRANVGPPKEVLWAGQGTE